MNSSTQQNKPWWASKAILGGIVAMAGAFGYAVDDATQVQLTDALVVAATGLGGLLAVIGRVKADRPIRGTKADKALADRVRNLAPLVLIPVLLLGSACAAQNAKDRALQASHMTNGVVLELYETYLDLYEQASPGVRVVMTRDVAPVLNSAKKTALLMSSTVQTWRASDEAEKPESLDALKKNLQIALNDALVLLEQVRVMVSE